MRITPTLLERTSAALAEALRFEYPADAVLSQFFRENKALGARERAFVAETVYAVLRRRRTLERIVGSRASPRRLVIAALVRLAGYNQRQLEEALRRSEAEAFAALKAEPAGEPTLAELADFPDWLVERLRPRLGDEALLALARGLNQGAPLDLRVNTLKATREQVLEQFAAEGIEARPCTYAPSGIRLKDKPALQRHPLYLSGAVEVQDEGSQLLGYLLAPKRAG